jgi:Na+-driven multidrug efflux pump
LLVQWRPELLIRAFAPDPQVRAIAVTFLTVTSWNFVAQGIIFTCSSLFQGLGDTRPAMLSTCTRLVTFALPAVWMSAQPQFQIEHIWYLSVATMTLQVVVSLLLLRAQFRRRLSVDSPVAAAA